MCMNSTDWRAASNVRTLLNALVASTRQRFSSSFDFQFGKQCRNFVCAQAAAQAERVDVARIEAERGK